MEVWSLQRSFSIGSPYKKEEKLEQNFEFFKRRADCNIRYGRVEQSDKGNQGREELRNELFKIKSIIINGSDEQRYQGTQGGQGVKTNTSST